MKMSAEVNKVLKTLRIDLSGWTYPKGLPKAIVFTPPSLLTNEEYANIKLRQLAVPPGPQSSETLAKAFDNMVLHLRGEFDGNPTEGMGHSWRLFIGKDLFRLMFLAGMREEAEIEFDAEANRMVVMGEHTFGIDGNKVYGYAVNTELEFDLAEAARPKEMSCRERGFTALYKRALELEKPEAVRTLEMLRAYRTSPWSSMARWVKFPHDEAGINFLGEIIYTATDPVGELYKRMVPRKLSASKFEKIFGKLESRVLEPNQQQRSRLWRSLFI